MIKFVYQNQPLGTGDAVLKTKKLRGNTKVKLDNARNPNIKLNRYILLKSSILQTRK